MAGGGAAALRGAVLIAIAVVVGVVLLGQGLDSGFVPSSSNGDDVATGGDDDDGDDDEDATTTTEAPTARPPAEVTTWVLNGSNVSGVAQTNTDLLVAGGYATVPAANAAQDVAATVVYYAAGYEADAAAVAAVLGLPASAAQALPTPPPPAVPNGDIKGAHVIIVLGPDIQNAQPPGATTTTG